ncbi:hypothetical protein AYJ54_00550 [Bradyrhizobium centrolobii]|uniref:Uncharacterized protein n=1 Tax=Bradyrhizobium centrolobii TaxID=1505087 RepID=A0A176YHW7_9BRAD|nr:hypothetical protein [Bradyrhizobium centrolobii]OAF05429.1 hypothetical protein AYJ54_00550 [Bradyrhizobium centrolobii]
MTDLLKKRLEQIERAAERVKYHATERMSFEHCASEADFIQRLVKDLRNSLSVMDATAFIFSSQESLLRSLIGWLETQDPQTKYNWSNCSGGCLIGLWGASVGLSWDALNRNGNDGQNIYTRMIWGNALAAKLPHTFGAALERARAALARD